MLWKGFSEIELNCFYLKSNDNQPGLRFVFGIDSNYDNFGWDKNYALSTSRTAQVFEPGFKYDF